MYSPPKNNFNSKDILTTLSLKDLLKLMSFSREQHIIEMFAEEIVAFHSQIIKELENVEFQADVGGLNSEEEPRGT